MHESNPTPFNKPAAEKFTFLGLNFMDKYGSIKFPTTARPSNLGDGVVSKKFRTPDKTAFEFYINKAVLDTVLLEVDGKNLFRISQGRFMVLAKVNNIHLPFYISTSGTDGKNKGEWYPFFGLAGTWLVKGDIAQDGKMEYHPEITKVQELLNQNLKIPASYISPQGRFGGGPKNGSEPINVSFDLNDHFTYENYFFTGKRDIEYVRDVTGYDPRNVQNDEGGSSDVWIQHIVDEIQ